MDGDAADPNLLPKSVVNYPIKGGLALHLSPGSQKGGRASRRQYPTAFAPYSACAVVNPSNFSWSIRPDRENAEYLRYCSAFFAACSFQLAPVASAPYAASACENPSNSNCFINPSRENAEYLR